MRHRLGLTPESLAAELNLTPAVVVAWERGRIRPTGRAQQWLLWRGAMLDRDEALAASGLPECPALRDIVVATRDNDQSRSANAILAHMARCNTCLARKRFLEERFPPLPPPPLPLPLLVMVSAQRAVERTWRWLRRARD